LLTEILKIDVGFITQEDIIEDLFDDLLVSFLRTHRKENECRDE